MSDVLTVTAACLALGTSVGGGVFAVRYLWKTLQRFINPGPTIRE